MWFDDFGMARIELANWGYKGDSLKIAYRSNSFNRTFLSIFLTEVVHQERRFFLFFSRSPLGIFFYVLVFPTFARLLNSYVWIWQDDPL